LSFALLLQVALQCAALLRLCFFYDLRVTSEGKKLKFDISGGLIQFRFKYAENTRALPPAKSLSPKFSVSISGGAAADFVLHFSGKH
jgi:hypothetical protein